MRASATMIRVRSAGGVSYADVSKGREAYAGGSMSPLQAATLCAAQSLRCSQESVFLKEVSADNSTCFYEATIRQVPDLFAKGAAS